MGYLGARDLCAIAHVSRRCNDVTHDATLWRRLSRQMKHPRMPIAKCIDHREWYRRMEARIELRVCFLRHRPERRPVYKRESKWIHVPVERDVSLYQLRHAVAVATSSAPRLVCLWKPRVIDDGSRAVLVPVATRDDKAPGVIASYDLEHGSTLVCFPGSPGQESAVRDTRQLYATAIVEMPL
ncbi:F-box domain-containing protein [Medusavirus stheno T3]|uniref:F-box domain-containing protein n=1 Tax=Medusavirus stheno T3 TaxID=3069717 RepID=A0A7S8BEW3_9VIRU|nr:F-box domain-containing protein [Acanthamoeba castellanii medusavirus]QPB44603.1 F-box domain-containing protein [Medusavirus stheno T3]